jgi:hypothetical protein
MLAPGKESLMKRLAVLAAGAVTVSIGVAVLATSGSASHPGSQTLTFTESSRGETFRFIDLAPRSERRRGFPTRLSPGDEFVFGNTLLDSGAAPRGSG